MADQSLQTSSGRISNFQMLDRHTNIYLLTSHGLPSMGPIQLFHRYVLKYQHLIPGTILLYHAIYV